MLADSTVVRPWRPIHLTPEFFVVAIFDFYIIILIFDLLYLIFDLINETSVCTVQSQYNSKNFDLVQIVQSSFGAILPPSL